MIKRDLEDQCRLFSTKMPVITITGPRQSGKTTLVKTAFPGYAYANLEFPDIREFALEDPRGFLGSFKNGVILDEVQNVPALLSYIQGIVDQTSKMGRFVLTGSQNLLLLEKISQSLAGRTAILHLLPFSLRELSSAGYQFENFEPWIQQGFFPRLYDQHLSANEWLPSYIESYIERDVRSISQIRDLRQFQIFLRLCAGRIGQLINFSSIGNDAGVDQKTVHNWISILEATFTIFLIRPYYRNFNKRLIKSPKLYFHDTGLACNLLGLKTAVEIETFYARSSLFENMILSEIIKNELNQARRPQLFFWRDSNNHEIDCIYEKAGQLHAIEIKSGKTISSDFFKGLDWFKETAGSLFSSGTVIFGGENVQIRSGYQVMPWKDIVNFEIGE